MSSTHPQLEQLSSRAWWQDQAMAWIKECYQPHVDEDVSPWHFVRLCLSQGNTHDALEFVSMRAKNMLESQRVALQLDIVRASFRAGSEDWRGLLLTSGISADPKVRLAAAKAWHEFGDQDQAEKIVASTMKQINESPALGTSELFSLVASTMVSIGMGLDAKPLVMKAEQLADTPSNNSVNDAYTRCNVASVYAELGHQDSAAKNRDLVKQIYDDLEPKYRWWIVQKYFGLFADAELVREGIAQAEAEQDGACRSRAFATLAPTVFELDADLFSSVVQAGRTAAEQHEVGRGDLSHTQDLMGYAELAAKSGNQELVEDLITQAQGRNASKQLLAIPLAILGDWGSCWELTQSTEQYASRIATALEVIENGQFAS